MGPRAGLDGCGKSRPQRDSIPYRPGRGSNPGGGEIFPNTDVCITVWCSRPRTSAVFRGLEFCF